MKVGGKLFPQELSAKGARPADLGDWALVTIHAPSPIPHAQKLFPQELVEFFISITFSIEYWKNPYPRNEDF
jgi:hypothetical protein